MVSAVSLALARVAPALQATALAYARTLAEALDHVGVSRWSCSCKDGELLANELAARAQLGALDDRGQRDQPVPEPLRAVLGLPLGDTRMVGLACMLNWIGAMPEASAVLREAGGHWHDYGKEPREGRKVGMRPGARTRRWNCRCASGGSARCSSAKRRSCPVIDALR